jgi:DNA replication and repair protein RecF
MRRHFIDLGLAQVSKVYRHDLVDYNKVLQQRNSLLKNIAERKAKADELHLWDAQLVEYGTRLMYKRAEAIQRIAGFARESHKGISGGEENLTIHYLPFYLKEGESIAETKLPLAREINDRFAKELESNRLQELRRGTTLVGPQRDDLLFQIDGKDARQFASQGQQRTVVLAIKLAELEFMGEEVGEYPTLLLDDVLSELDFSRRSFFLETIGDKVQTLLTTTDRGNFRRDELYHSRQYVIIDGQLASEG